MSSPHSARRIAVLPCPPEASLTARTIPLLLIALLAACGGDSTAPDMTDTAPAAGGGVAITPPPATLRGIVPEGSPFHGVHGLRFDAAGTLHAASVIGQSIFTVDIETGAIETLIGPPEGMGDDIAFAADGTMVWTAIENGILYARSPGGQVRRVLEGYKGVNAVSFDPSGQRLFLTLVFYGDALYEVNLDGDTPPRLIAEGLGGMNAFEVADDGMIYGPLVFGGAVVRVDPETGAVETISEEFVSPGALKLESGSTALVLDDGEHIKRVNLGTGETTDIATMPADADNLAIAADGRVFVSLSETNAIVELDSETGQTRYVVEPAALNSPAGFDAGRIGGRDVIVVGDLFGGIKIVDLNDTTIGHRRVELFQPSRIAIDGSSILAVSQVFGTIQRFDTANFEVTETWEGFMVPGEVLPTVSGGLIVADSGTGSILRVDGAGPDQRRPLLVGLDFPMGLAAAPDGTIWITETGGGRILSLAPDGTVATLASGLGQPEGIVAGPDGRILVVDVAARSLLAIDPDSGQRSVIAEALPIGLANGPSLFRDVAVFGDRIYINSDIDNMLYEVTPR